jgi:E3 ubiquitin-protein ligase RNF115/126
MESLNTIEIKKNCSNPQKNIKNSYEESEFYKLGKTKIYYCYSCKKKFNKLYIENAQIECIFCYSQICEEILPVYEQDIPPPDKFKPYSTLPQEQEPRIVRLSNPNNPLVQFVTSLINSEYENDEIENILNYILNNDNNRYGSPPAAQSEIKKLNKYILTKDKLNDFGTENSCSVCKEDFVLGNKMMDLPCKHYFHEECLMPWLKQHDSCPICRFELKTDDDDYEKMKLQRNSNIINQNRNNQIQNIIINQNDN